MTAATHRRATAVLAAVAGLLALTTVALGALGGRTATGDLAFGLGSGTFAAVGLVLAARRPDNPIGWEFTGAGLLFLTQGVCNVYCDDAFRAGVRLPAAAYVANPTQWIFAPAMVLGFVLPVLQFPDGRLRSPRWRWAAAAGWAGMAATSLGAMVAPGRLQNFPADNPLALAIPATVANTLQLSLLLYVGAFFAAVAGIVRRYRRAPSDTRAQLRWFVWGTGVAVLTLLAQLASMALTGDVGPWVLLLPIMPASMAVAILRYRLYDIDRVISRTVGWTVVTATVLAPYLVLVAGVGAIARSPVAVAALTLLTVAALRPIHRLAQRRVDRRFNRSRFDAQRTVDAFAVRLRDTVDAATVEAELVTVVGATLEPRSIGIWSVGRR